MNDKTRREFLKNCFQIGGYAGIACLGMGAIDDARGWGILPAVVTSGGSGGNTSWADWDETTEAGWGDSANNFICLFENTVANSNETGAGAGLTGADLTITDEAGSVAGATGFPPSRIMGATDCFIGTDTIPHAVRDSITGWTLFFKFNPSAAAAERRILQWANNGAGGTNQIIASLDATNNLFIQVVQGDATARINWTSTNVITEGSNVWVIIEDDLTNVRAGYSQVAKPDNWTADFTESVSGTTVTWNTGNELDWVGHANCGLFGRIDNSNGIVGYVYYWGFAIKPLLTV